MTNILAMLRASRVFSVNKEGDDFEFVDGCDFCFGVTWVDLPKPWHDTSLI